LQDRANAAYLDLSDNGLTMLGFLRDGESNIDKQSSAKSLLVF
jgi:hypothetical protein